MFTSTISPDWFPTCVVFDCDGILIDSETKWNQVQRQVFGDYGIEITPQLEIQLTGSSAPDVAKVLAGLTQSPGLSAEEHYQQVFEHLTEVEHDTISAGVDLIPGARQVMAKLANVLPVAVASNSSSSLLTEKLETYDYAPLVKTWVGSDDVAAPKPAPDIYQEAVRRLGGEPARALTFEDSHVGVRAAQSAGTKTLVLTSSLEGAPEANGYFSSFEDPALLAEIDRWLEMIEAESSR